MLRPYILRPSADNVSVSGMGQQAKLRVCFNRSVATWRQLFAQRNPSYSLVTLGVWAEHNILGFSQRVNDAHLAAAAHLVIQNGEVLNPLILNLLRTTGSHSMMPPAA